MYNTNWSPVVQSPSVTRVSISPGATALWALNESLAGNNAYYYAGTANSWTLAPGVHLTSIATTPEGVAWGVDGTQTAADNIYLYSDGQWVQPMSGVLTNIALAPDGAVWGVNGSQPTSDPSNIYRWAPEANSWIGIAGYLTSIAVGTDNVVWGLGPQTESNIFRYTGALGQPWENYTTGQQTTLAAIAVGADNSVWGVDGDNNLWTLVEGSGFEQISGTGIWLSASDVNSVWLVGTDGSTSVTNFPTLQLSISIGETTVYQATLDSEGSDPAAGPRTPLCVPGGLRIPLTVTEERWLDGDLGAAQQYARLTSARPIRNVGISAAEGLEIAKFAWEILKDGRPTWGGAEHTQSSVLNPAEPNWIYYVHAKAGASTPITVRVENFFGSTAAFVKMTLAGTYHAAAASASATPGYYIPDIHFDFAENWSRWGYHLNGNAQIGQVSNQGGITPADPVNPLVYLSATIRVSTLIHTASKTFYFKATGTDGFAIASK